MALNYIDGLDVNWNANEATEAWVGGGGGVPAGRYVAEIVGVATNDKVENKHRVLELKILQALDEENKHAVGTQITDLFGLVDKEGNHPQNYYAGVFKACAPWSDAPQFRIINPQTQSRHFLSQWLIGSARGKGLGAKVEITVILKERQVVNPNTRQAEARTYSEVKRGYKLIEPSDFAKAIVAQAGLNIQDPEVPEAHPPQQNLLQAAVQGSNGAAATPPPAQEPNAMAGFAMNPQQ